jgi:ABC-type Fe3+ transport system substrate-binding protein
MRVNRRELLLVIGTGATAALLGACEKVTPTVVAPATPVTPATAAPAADAAWQALLKDAQVEKTVVLRGPPTAAVRTSMTKAFQDAFGIEVQYSGGPSSEAVTQFANERAAGIYSTDVILAGADSMYSGLYAGHMLDPIAPVLVNPSAVDVAKWPGGKHVYMDPEQRFILRINNYSTPLLQVNTQIIDPGTIKSWHDLLKPEYTGRIASFDPRSSGAGLSAATYLATELGDAYVSHLYVDQKPTFSRDHRQLADWLARGTYPLVLALRDVEFQQIKSDGFPVALLRNPPEAAGFVSAGSGLIGLLNKAPHPHAAGVMVNWLASKDGMEVWSRAQSIPPIRTDIDMAAYPAEEVVDPTTSTYFDSYGWDYVTKDRDGMAKHLQELLK